MEQPVPVKEVKILETAEDIQERREQVSVQLILLNFSNQVRIIISSILKLSLCFIRRDVSLMINFLNT
jgi:hypothetical protein